MLSATPTRIQRPLPALASDLFPHKFAHKMVQNRQKRAVLARAVAYPHAGLTGVCIYAAALYTPPHARAAQIRINTGENCYDMRPGRVKCGDASMRGWQAGQTKSA